VDVMVSSSGSVRGIMEGGQARVIGVAAAQRMGGSFANVPTFREGGVDTVGMPAWRGFLGAQKLTPAQVAFWDEVLSVMVESPDWKKNLEEGNLTQQYMKSREFGRYLDAEYASTKAIMTELGLIK